MCGSSEPRAIFTCPSATATVSPDGMALTSSPLGPLTRTFSASALTSTPLGIATGIFPMRDTVGFSSPDVAEHFAAEAGLPRLLVRHDALRGRHDRHAEAPEHGRDVVGLRVHAPARARDPFDPRNDRFALGVVFEAHAQDRPALVLDLAEGGDVALLLEHFQDGLLHARGGHVHLVVAGAHAIAQARQQIAQRIAGLHRFTTTPSGRPGCTPCWRSDESRCGRGRTCGTPPGGGRTPGSAGSCAS